MPTAGAGRKKLGDIFFDSTFQYVLNIGGAQFVTGLETLTGTIPIQSDADFIAVHSTYDMGVTNAVFLTLPNGGALVQLTDGSSQRQLQSAPIPSSTLFGTAQRPYMWPLAYRFRANAPIGFQVTGTAAAMIGVTLRFVIGGFKVPLGSL